MHSINARAKLGAAAAFILLSAFANAAVAAEPAEPPITNPLSLIDNITVENMTQLLTELGAQKITTQVGTGGGKVVTFYDGEVPFNLGPFLCDIRPGKCIATTMVVIIDPGTKNYTLETFNKFNRDALFVALVKLDGNRFAVGRVLLADGGVTKKNFAINLASFVLTFRQAMTFLDGQLVAAFQQNGALQAASADAVPPRAVIPTPAEMAQITDAMSKHYQTTLGVRK